VVRNSCFSHHLSLILNLLVSVDVASIGRPKFLNGIRILQMSRRMARSTKNLVTSPFPNQGRLELRQVLTLKSSRHRLSTSQPLRHALILWKSSLMCGRSAFLRPSRPKILRLRLYSSPDRLRRFRHPRHNAHCTVDCTNIACST
jgi:hypothetical protein